MQTRSTLWLLRFGSAFALMAALAACTKGGQFDPTTLLDNSVFDSKKPLPGKREPVFPNGVPGAQSGIPADLYKGYQPPPQQAADIGAAPTPIVPVAEEPAKLEAKPKPKPKPRVARAPARPRTEISVGLGKRPKPAAKQEEPQPAQTGWPAPPSTAQAQPAQTVWPAPPSTAQTQPSQSVWPAPPPTGAVQQSAQPAQSIWPNPPTTGATAQ
jgi:hypothetical protein